MGKLLDNLETLAKATMTGIQSVAADLVDNAWKAREQILLKSLGRVRDTYDPNDDGVVDDTTGIQGKDVAATAPADGEGLVFNAANNEYEPAPIPSASNMPTADEKAALAGTSGSPSAANKYVTDADPRNSDTRTPKAHTHIGGDVTSAVAEATKAYALHLGSVSTIPNLGYKGTTHEIAFSETAIPGEVVYVDSSGKAAKAKADAATTIPVAYLVLQTVSAGDVAAGTEKLVLERGYFRNDSWAARTVGGSAGMLYLSDATAGAMAQSLPGTGNKIQALGFAMSSKVVAFRPDVTWATAS
jgi:hypothetical protein